MRASESCSRRAGGSSEGGFTLVELLVATAMSLILAGAVVAMLTSVLQSQPENAERTAQIEAGRVMLERTVRELRQGEAVTGQTGTSTSLTVDTYVRSGCNGGAPTATAVPCRVRYSCAGSAGSVTCTRAAGSEPARTYITDLASPNVFSYGTTTSPTCNAATAGAPQFVCVKLAYPAANGAEGITLEDSAYLRNTGTP